MLWQAPTHLQGLALPSLDWVELIASPSVPGIPTPTSSPSSWHLWPNILSIHIINSTRADTPSAWHRIVPPQALEPGVKGYEEGAGVLTAACTLGLVWVGETSWQGRMVVLQLGLRGLGLWQLCDDHCPFAPDRLAFRGMSVSRPNAVVGKCRMIRHSRDKKNEPNPQRCVPFYSLPCVCFLLPPSGGAGCRNGALEWAPSTGQGWSRRGWW